MTDELIILNVDDTEAIRYAKSRTLRAAGFLVEEAASGLEALSLVATRRPALVLLDVKLPDISGFEVCRRIKQDHPATLVLQVSASFVAPGDRVRGLEAGADSYLTQPVQPAELVASVRALLRLRQAEDALRQLNATLEERVQARTAELAAANRQLITEMAERQRAEEALRHSQKMEAIGQLTGGLAHDFNNLLTGIIGGLAMMRTRISQGRLPDAERYAAAATSSAERAAKLTHRLLAFARRQPLDFKPVAVNDLVASMQELISRTVGPAIQVEAVLPELPWLALCDAGQLESALLNLVINARDAMPEGGQLRIETAGRELQAGSIHSREAVQPGQYVMLCVSDSGTGMAPEVLERVFDPFFTTKPIGQGTGLGLSMIYGFVQQSGGHICISSRPGQGTRVCLYLPRHAGRAGEEAGGNGRAESTMVGKGERVLIVDDEAEVRMLLVDALQDVGYQVTQASDAAAALRIVESKVPIDLLVTDVGLPGGLNGRQLADAARVLRPGLTVLFITGYAEHAAIGQDSLEPGMHVLAKPFTLERLASKLRSLAG